MADICERGNEPSDSIKFEEFLDLLRTGWLLKQDFAPWNKKVMVLSFNGVHLVVFVDHSKTSR